MNNLPPKQTWRLLATRSPICGVCTSLLLPPAPRLLHRPPRPPALLPYLHHPCAALRQVTMYTYSRAAAGWRVASNNNNYNYNYNNNNYNNNNAPPPLSNTSLSSSSSLYYLASSVRHFSVSRNYNKKMGKPFWRRKGYYPWRIQIITRMNMLRRRNKHIWPRRADEREDPVTKDKASGSLWKYSKTDLLLSMKRIALYGRLLKGLHVQDALDWLAAIPVVRLNPIFNLISYARNDCIVNFGADPCRLYIHSVEANRKPAQKYVRFFRVYNVGDVGYSMISSWRNTCIVRLRELPINEYYHKLYILKEVPRSMAADMRVCLHEKRVGPSAYREWYPYLNSYTRFNHKRRLKWLDRTRQFDYFASRKEWIQKYTSTLLRRQTEIRASRGLEAKPTLDNFTLS
eukprot:GHVS01081077.1.p1 GENE.GHVS01081077.1~~GHVS01081077.1.p1  ORF type:complete len:401 (+),score=65.21 GHVS01081077.1:416-1618(+)